MSKDIQFKSDIDVRQIQSMGGDHMVVAAAKVSTIGNEALEYAMEQYAEEHAGLINYLVKQKHWNHF